jgi:hypothetical protein
MIDKIKDSNGIINSVFAAYAILLLHILLIAGLGVLVLFFRGVITYMLWIFLGGAAIILGSAYYFYRKIKREGKQIEEILKSPTFTGREVEVSLLGGLASLRLGKSNGAPAIENFSGPVPQLEDPETVRLRELNELVRLLENDLITLEEYKKAKAHLFKP